MLLNKSGNIELHIIDSEKSFIELSKGTMWNIPKSEFDIENILVIKTQNKKRCIRIELGIYFDEKNNLLELEKALNIADDKIKLEIKKFINSILIKDFKQHIENRKIDYDKIKEDSIIIIQNKDVIYDINFIITVRGRIEFAQPMYDSFKTASKKSPLNITYTIVEHSIIPEHAKFCKKNKINYIWIKPDNESLFNKCLSYNMGAFFGNNSKYILFHDIDCLIQSDFFLKLSKNISNKQCKAIQCFTGRRVLYINEEFTPKVISGEILVEDLSIDMEYINYPILGGKIMIGAPGGSILIERDLYFEVGGYDAELFLANSPEDAFFWEKVDAISKMHISDEPDIEIYHMYHPPTYMDNPYLREMNAVNNSFKIMSVEDKKSIIKFKAEMIKQFKK